MCRSGASRTGIYQSSLELDDTMTELFGARLLAKEARVEF